MTAKRLNVCMIVIVDLSTTNVYIVMTGKGLIHCMILVSGF